MRPREWAFRLLKITANARAGVRGHEEYFGWMDAMRADADALAAGLLAVAGRAAATGDTAELEREILLPARILLLPGELPGREAWGEVGYREAQEMVLKGAEDGIWPTSVESCVSHAADMCLLSALRGYASQWHMVRNLASAAMGSVGPRGAVAALVVLYMLHTSAAPQRMLRMAPWRTWDSRSDFAWWHHGAQPTRDIDEMIATMRRPERLLFQLELERDNPRNLYEGVSAYGDWLGFYRWIREEAEAWHSLWKADAADPTTPRGKRILLRMLAAAAAMEE